MKPKEKKENMTKFNGNMITFIPGTSLEELDYEKFEKGLEDMKYSIENKDIHEKEGKKVATFRLSNATKLNIGGPVKLPKDNTEYENVAKLAWWWEGAEEEAKSYDSYYVVILSAEDVDVLEAHFTAAHACANILNINSDAKAVLWNNIVLQNRNTFLSQLNTSQENKSIPVNLWVYFQVGKFEDGKAGVATKRLKKFGSHEMEIVSKDNYKLNELYPMATYLASLNIVKLAIEDGHKVQGPKEDVGEVTLQKAYAQLNKDQDVLRIEYK
jgi:hypothetical protein